MFHIVKVILSFFILIMLSACVPSEYSSGNDYILGADEAKFSGTVVDGYINSATVCLDINMDGICESSEPSSQTNSDGVFEFLLSDLNETTLVSIIATGGVDTSTNKSFVGQLVSVINTPEVDANSSVIISPLTDLVSVTFFNSLEKNSLSLSDAKSSVATALNISLANLALDPMKNIEIFSVSQEIQHTKELLQNTTASSSLSFEDTQRYIKKEIVVQNFNIDRMITAVEIDLAYDIPQNQVTFLKAQIGELKNSLGTLTNNTSLEVSNLNRYQKTLDTLLVPINATLSTADNSTTLEVVNLNITTESITQSIYNARDAQLDAQACKNTNGYNVLISTSFVPSDVTDAPNGILLRSSYSFGTGLAESEVQMFYTDIKETLVSENVIVFEDNYYFAFDQAWTQNSNKTIYIQTPRESDGLYSCYRYELNSINAGEIRPTKVYRYTDI